MLTSRPQLAASQDNLAFSPLRALLIYLGVIFVGGALLTPWVYWFAQWAGGHVAVLRRFAEEPFQRYLTRTFIVLAVAGLWPFARANGVSSWSAFGIVKPQAQWPKFIAGLLFGFGSLAVIAVLALCVGVRRWDTDHSSAALFRHLLNSGGAAIIVATVEEIVFRGALFGSLRKACHWTTALLISSAIYALVHFFERPEPITHVDWASGLVLLPKLAQGFLDLPTLVPGFFNLTLAGILLGLAYQRSGNLYFSMGLHAGWIFWLKSYGYLTNPVTASNTAFWGSRKLIDGWVSFLVLSGTLWLAWRFSPWQLGERKK